MTITNMTEFERQIEQDMEIPAEVTQEVTQKLAIQMLRGAVLGNPVDSGRSRANWNVSTGTADTSYDWDATDPSGARTIRKGTNTILAAPVYKTIWISNGLPYIVPLEQGHSRQAPNGWITATLARVEGQFHDV